MIGEIYFRQNLLYVAFGKVLAKSIHIELFTYWLIVVLVHAFDYQRKAREGVLNASRPSRPPWPTPSSIALKMAAPALPVQHAARDQHARAQQDTQGALRMLSGVGDLLRLALRGRQPARPAQAGARLPGPLFGDRAGPLPRPPRRAHGHRPRRARRPGPEPPAPADRRERDPPRHRPARRRRPHRGPRDPPPRHPGDRDPRRRRRPARGPELDASYAAGLRNVTARLLQLYSRHRHRVSVVPGDDGGTVVSIEIPSHSRRL